MLNTNLTPQKSLTKASKLTAKDNNNRLIIKAIIKHKSLNRRQLSQITDIEICTICKPLCDGVKYGYLIISHYALCPLKKSKRKVMYFSLPKAGGANV